MPPRVVVLVLLCCLRSLCCVDVLSRVAALCLSTAPLGHSARALSPHGCQRVCVCVFVVMQRPLISANHLICWVRATRGSNMSKLGWKSHTMDTLRCPVALSYLEGHSCTDSCSLQAISGGGVWMQRNNVLCVPNRAEPLDWFII